MFGEITSFGDCAKVGRTDFLFSTLIACNISEGNISCFPHSSRTFRTDACFQYKISLDCFFKKYLYAPPSPYQIFYPKIRLFPSTL